MAQHDPPPPNELNAETLFDAWARHRATTGPRRLSHASAQKYRAIWHAWLKFLAGQQINWRQVGPATLEAFVHAIRPRSQRHGVTSGVTRARYWSAITAVYAYSELAAHDRGDPDFVNPLRGAVPPENARREDPTSTVLLPHHWAALYDAWPDGSDWTLQRDRAMLSLLLDTAATVQELQQLSTHDVIGLRAKSGPATVSLRGRRSAQMRTLVLSERGRAAVRDWMTARERLYTPDDTLFVSRKGLRAASAMAIWHSLASLVVKAMKSFGDMAAYHRGPNVLRNAVLLRWLLEGVSPEEVARRAGLGSVRKLERMLEHLDETARARLKQAMSESAAGAGGPAAGN